MRKDARLLAWLFLAAAAPGVAGSHGERVTLFPKLRVGQTFTYQIRYQAEKKVMTQSAVTPLMVPAGGQMDVQRMLRVEVEEARPDGKRATLVLRTRLEMESQAEQQSAGAKTVEFALHGDGRVSDELGMDALSAEELGAWRNWVAQFGIAAVFPEKGVMPGEKWKSTELVAEGPVARLVWEKESEYVRDVLCPVDSRGVTPEVNHKNHLPQESCAVILTRATLKQKSSVKDATPEDYELHELRTAGTARGRNEIVTYISLQTGLVVRATEEANQAMDVVVALADGTNRVRYNVDAKSHSEVLMVVESPLEPR